MGRILRCVGILAGLAVLGVASVLVLAHREIRSIDPKLPRHADLLRAVAADQGPGPTHVFHVNTFLQRYSDGRLAGSPAFVLEWSDGRRFMIDTGMDRETALEFGRGSEIAFGASPARALGTVAEQMGEALEPVAGLAFTHLHHDHTQGIVALRTKRPGLLPVFQTPFQFAVRNYTTDMGFRFIAEVMESETAKGCGVPTELAATIVSDRAPSPAFYPIPAFPGLVAVAAGGHTPGSTIFLARVGRQHFLFTGDITNSHPNLIENRPKSKIYSRFIVPEFPERLEKLRRWARDFDAREDVTAVVSHDQGVLEGLPIPAWSAEARTPEAGP